MPNRPRPGLGEPGSPARLQGWKAIGRFLGCTERTARRWEAQRHLPVHRIPGGSRQAVWATPTELTRWMEEAPAEIQAELRANAADPTIAVGSVPEIYAGNSKRLRWWSAAAGALVILVGTLAIAVLRVAHDSGPAGRRDLAAAYADDPEARQAYEVAAFELSERTAASLSAAEAGFRQLASRYPDRAVAWSGLAEVYILQREFGALSDGVAFPMAARAGNTALALDPKSASAWLDKGYVAWWWKGDAATAFDAFERAIRLDPGWARAYHWYATALENHGDCAKSLQTIAQARRLDPENRAIVADEAVIQFDCGLRQQGLATLEKLAEIDPQFVSWHQYLTHAFLAMGRDADFLRESMVVAHLRGQSEIEAEFRLAQQRLQQGGRTAMFDVLTEQESKRIAAGSGSALKAARYRALANDKVGVLKWLRAAQDRREQGLASLYLNLEFATYRNDPEIQQFTRQPEASERHDPRGPAAAAVPTSTAPGS